MLKDPQKIKSDVKSLNIIFDLDETLIFAEKLYLDEIQKNKGKSLSKTRKRNNEES